MTRDYRPRRSRLLRSDRHRARVRLYHRNYGRRSNASSIWWRVDPPRVGLPEPRTWSNALPGGTSRRRASRIEWAIKYAQDDDAREDAWFCQRYAG